MCTSMPTKVTMNIIPRLCASMTKLIWATRFPAWKKVKSVACGSLRAPISLTAAKKMNTDTPAESSGPMFFSAP